MDGCVVAENHEPVVDRCKLQNEVLEVKGFKRAVFHDEAFHPGFYTDPCHDMNRPRSQILFVYHQLHALWAVGLLM